jgi:hypothetical protein
LREEDDEEDNDDHDDDDDGTVEEAEVRDRSDDKVCLESLPKRGRLFFSAFARLTVCLRGFPFCGRAAKGSLKDGILSRPSTKLPLQLCDDDNDDDEEEEDDNDEENDDDEDNDDADEDEDDDEEKEEDDAEETAGWLSASIIASTSTHKDCNACNAKSVKSRRDEASFAICFDTPNSVPSAAVWSK